MADVMLINPSSKEILSNAGDRPPLGLLYIGTVLKNRGHDVRVRDLDHICSIFYGFHNKLNPELIAERKNLCVCCRSCNCSKRENVR